MLQRRPGSRQMVQWRNGAEARAAKLRELSPEEQLAADEFKKNYLSKTLTNAPVPLSIRQQIKRDLDAGMNSYQIGERYGVSPHWVRTAKANGTLDREAYPRKPQPDIALSEHETGILENMRNREERRPFTDEEKDLIKKHLDAGISDAEMARRAGLHKQEIWRLKTGYGKFDKYPVSRRIDTDTKARIGAHILENGHLDFTEPEVLKQVASQYGAEPGHVGRIAHELAHNNNSLVFPGTHTLMKRYQREMRPAQPASPETPKIKMPKRPTHLNWDDFFADGGAV
jgi:transposase-like protein